jgi:hypothetical protein
MSDDSDGEEDHQEESKKPEEGSGSEAVDQPEDGDQAEEEGSGISRGTCGPGGIGMSASEMAAEEATSHLAVEEGHISEAASELGTPAARDPAHAGGASSVTCHEWEHKKVANVPDLEAGRAAPRVASATYR